MRSAERFSDQRGRDSQTRDAGQRRRHTELPGRDALQPVELPVWWAPGFRLPELSPTLAGVGFSNAAVFKSLLPL